MLVLRIMLTSVCNRSDINMSKSDLSVRSDKISVLRIVLMSLYSRSEINSKSDLGVKSGISVRNHKNHVNVSV